MVFGNEEWEIPDLYSKLNIKQKGMSQRLTYSKLGMEEELDKQRI